MSASYHHLNDYFPTIARAAVRALLSHIDEVPDLMMTLLPDLRIRNRVRYWYLRCEP